MAENDQELNECPVNVMTPCTQKSIISELIERGRKNAADIESLFAKHRDLQQHVDTVWKGLENQLEETAQQYQLVATIDARVNDLQAKVLQLNRENHQVLEAVKTSELEVLRIGRAVDAFECRITDAFRSAQDQMLASVRKIGALVVRQNVENAEEFAREAGLYAEHARHTRDEYSERMEQDEKWRLSLRKSMELLFMAVGALALIGAGSLGIKEWWALMGLPPVLGLF